MYSDLYLQNEEERRVPRYLFVPAVILVAGISFFSLYGRVGSTAQASSVKITEYQKYVIDDTQVGLFFSTDQKLPAYVIYGEKKDTLEQVAYDVRDLPGSATARKNIYVELQGLRPLTQYYFRLIIDDKIAMLGTGTDNTDTITTARAKQASATTARPIYGKVITPDGQGLPEALAIISADPYASTKTKIVISKSTGEWLANLNWYVDDQESLKIRLIHDDYTPSTVRAVASRAAPLPQSIVIGTDYTFVAEGGDILPASTTRTQAKDYVVSLLYPESNAVISATKPLIKGKGVPGTPVSVTVDSSPPLQLKTTVSATGVWIAESAQAFAPGRYLLKVAIQDNYGAVRSLERAFTIAKAGEQVLGESVTQLSTPSATLIPTQVVSVTPALTPLVTAPFITQPITATPPQNLCIIDGIYQECPGGTIPHWVIYMGVASAIGGFFFLQKARMS